MAYANGDEYEGDYEDGKMHGKGIFKYANGEATYDGCFKYDKRSGEGKMTYADGDEYDGNWKDGKKHDQVALKYVNSDVYDGYYKDSKKHDKGSYRFAKGPNGDGDVYVGEYIDD
jgi:hypothetical protein